tara:strand:- start:16022 stop:16855 length:834 start_codon:yes stop_codon:yes gene_type:complete
MIEKMVLKNNNTLSLQKTKDIILSIQFSLDGFSFCTSNSVSKEKLFFKKYTFNEPLNSPEELLDEIKGIFKSDVDLQLEYTDVEVIHQNNLCTLVPNEYFDEQSLQAYLKYTVKTLKNDFITFDEIAEIEAKNVYIPYVNINNYLFQNFGEFEFQHHSSVLIKKLLSINTYQEKVMYVHVTNKTFDLVILAGNKLLFSNSFSYISKEDFIYYILFTAEQNQLNPEVFALYFLGDITPESNLYKITYTYIKNVLFLESNNAIYKKLKLSNHSNFILLG